MGKSATLLIVLILAASSLVMAKSAGAAIPKPSVPEFTLKIVEHPYDVPQTYGIDQYTGKTIITNQGYHVDNRTVEFKIKNQPFIPYTEADGHYIDLYYNVSYKGHYGEDWMYYSHDSLTDFFQSQSNSDYTVISFSNIPTAGEVDFRLQALVGYYTETGHPWMDVYEYKLTGQTSDWSNTQTITIGESASTTTPNTSPSQSSPTPTASSLPSPNATATPETSAVQTGVLFGLGWEEIALIILSVAVVGLIALVVFQRRGNKRTPLASG